MGRIHTRPTYPVELVDELAMIFVRAAVDRLMSELETRNESALEDGLASVPEQRGWPDKSARRGTSRARLPAALATCGSQPPRCRSTRPITGTCSGRYTERCTDRYTER